ncbi:hypothetical protein R3P38DRAFT_2824658 [Favolaschia claudopus]|uniref:Uncharacterized protein n=1 Tax=Favolaschia claudopus TaxID=2862362 RepID=A0AAW0EII1_9AGAR
MSLHDFESRAGLDTMLLHFSHDSSHSLSSSAALEGFIVVPKSDRPPLAAKSHNVQSRPAAKRASKSAKLGSRVSQDISFAVSASRPNSPREYDADAESDPPFSLLLPSRPCTPFQPLPPVLATSPLRLSSFLDDLVSHSHSLHNESNTPSPAPSLRAESPPPRPLLAINIPSVSHPNSPYVPWASSVRQNILRPLTPSSPVSVYSRPYSRSGARAPEPQELDPPPPKHKLLRLSKSLKNLKRTVQQSVKHVKNAFKKTPKARTEAVVDYLPPPSPPCLSPIPPPLPSPVASCDSSNTNTLVDWLRECELKLERAPPKFMTLEEYEARGSWMDLTTQDESEIRSVPMPHSMDDISESVHSSRPTSPVSNLVSPVHTPMLPACSPMSPTCPGSLFPHLSMYDLWPTPPRHVPTTRGPLETRNREMSMPGGWKSTLRCSPRGTS